MIGLLHSRICQLLLMSVLAGSVAHGQGCEDFSLEAEASSETAEFGKPLSVQLRLANYSPGTVTVYAPHLPTDWSVYEKSGTRWALLWSARLRPGVASSSPQPDTRPWAEKFPPEEYVKVAPEGVLTRKIDFDLWGTKVRPNKYSSDRIRIFFKYHFEPQGEETQLNMLPCYLQTEPIELGLITKKQRGNKKSSAGGDGSH